MLLSAGLGILAVITVVTAVNMLGGPFLDGRRNRRRSLPRSHRGSDRAILEYTSDKETQLHYPSVSVCIPARDEARNIATLLASLRDQTVPPRSILVLDDHSQDETASIVARYAREDDRVRLLEGASLPPGWTGKNWACHQLANAAEGEIILFVDADVRPGRQAVEHTLDTFANFHADAVSAFPKQLLSGIAATMIIPVMDLILYGFLPLPLVYRTRATSLAAANGQWFGFRREMYRRIGGHAAVRDEIVEDVTLARAVKSAGGRLLLASGNGSVDCRMYERFSEIREGFSKNFFAAFGFNTIAFAGVLGLLLAVFVLPYVLLFTAYWIPALIAVLLNLSIRALLAWGAGHPAVTVFLHPLGVLAAVLIGLDAIRLRYRHGAVRWKGRDIIVGTARVGTTRHERARAKNLELP